MKIHAFSVAVGVASSLMVSSAAPAAFSGLFVEHKGGSVHFSCNIWTCFTSQQDQLLSITQAQINAVAGASLFQHPLGTSTAPNSVFFPLPGFETLQFDSFVTIGLKSIPVGGTDSTALEPGAAFTGPGGTTGFSGGWFNSNPENDQGAPGAHGAPIGGIPGQFYVLIAQLTLQGPLVGDIHGSMTVVWKAAGGTSATFTRVSFFCIPSPAALALFGVAGMTARRRRA